MKIDRPRVSIIVPVYNVECYIEECVTSIMKQCFKDFEVLLIDDGSTDSSGLIIDRLALMDDRIRAIHQNNAGPSAARNHGLSIASGDFVSFVDGDDRLEPDFLSYMLQMQNESQSPLVLSRNCFTTNDQQQIEHDRVRILSGEKAAAMFLYPDIALGAWNKLYSRSFLINHSILFDERFRAGEGLQFIVKCALNASSVSIGSRKVYHYRTNNSSSATSKPDIEGQGIGALEALSSLENTCGPFTPLVQQAFLWRLWSTYGYCLNQIIKANQKKEHYYLYKNCIKYRRSHAIEQIKAHISIYQKIFAFFVFISPTFVSYLSAKGIKKK
ncbi:glycosyl transferase [Bifidobacterium pseudolongum subsp. globosum]|uniref:glycosyltransferase family 2 protein n=1 Tax=Bifidobacterium pseudolongum TaxID=1694 RepID=UPI001020EB75|nr:glycosyltransferase [Bifidobacterium pseudolongum]RYQ31457.1 glycosyl transferase [Bifidobacterium pseudolongum subsp. globosum]